MKFYTVDRKLNRFNDYVKRIMKEKKLNQNDVAYRLGISQAALSMRLNRQTSWSLPETILLCEILDTSLEEVEHEIS